MKPFYVFVYTAIAMSLLVGCDKAPSAEKARSTATPTVGNHVPPPQAVSTEINAPLPATDINLAMELVNGINYVAASDTVVTQVAITNNGTIALATAGSHPVELGLEIREKNGELEGPIAKQDFIRIPLPKAIAPGERLVIPVSFPAAPTFGGVVVLDGVQEGVSWFSSYGKPTLEVGRFQRCAGEPKSICLGDGTKVRQVN